MEVLYPGQSRWGQFIFEPAKKSGDGLSLDVKIQGGAGDSIGTLQTWCFDMLFMESQSDRKTGPGFLLHDSDMFYGLDSRQVANALVEVGKRCDEQGWQYIVPLNLELVPLGEEPGLAKYINEVRLTDAPGGGLFGFQFDD